MDAPTVLTEAYQHYDLLRQKWERENDLADNLGVLVIQAEGYEAAQQLADIPIEYWSLTSVRKFILMGGQSDAAIDQLIHSLAYGEEFLLLIVEGSENPSEYTASFHKMSRIGLT